jgi:hypothetical protein
VIEVSEWSEVTISSSLGDMVARERDFRNLHCNTGLRGVLSVSLSTTLVRVAPIPKWIASFDPGGFRDLHCNRGLRGALHLVPCQSLGLVRIPSPSRSLACLRPNSHQLPLGPRGRVSLAQQTQATEAELIASYQAS